MNIIKIEKRCSQCHLYKNLVEFNNNINSKDGKQSSCKQCTSEKMKRHRIEITYKAVFEKYNYRCALCGTTERLEVHHLLRKSVEDLDHLILACHDCHIQVLHKGAWNRKAEAYHCNRCGHSWYPKQPEIRICPKCKSPYWDKPRGRK